MSELDEPDEIGRELDAIFAEFFGPPTEMDLRGVDPATFALGLSYGFDSWQHARVVANNRRHVATAAQHWAEHHPSREFLGHAVGTDEIDLAWLSFQPMEVVRRQDSATAAARPLHIRGRAQDQSITAEPYGGREWRITVRDPRARRARVWVGWTTRQITQHEVIFENDLAEIDAEAPEEGGRPQRVRVRTPDPP